MTLVSARMMCEVISKWTKETSNADVSPEQVWEYAAKGELYMIFSLYEIAKSDGYGVE